jgi:uncharacterized protein YecE (DUF72 family)
LEELDALLEVLAGRPVAVELRNGNWATPQMLPKTKKFFTSRHAAIVMVDAPVDPHFTIFPNIDLVTTRKLAYLRAHGRNARGYIRGREVATRFDYEYKKPELEEIAARAVKAASSAEQVHVIYNNNKADYAPRAAAQFQEIVREEHPQVSGAARREAGAWAG